MKGTLVYRYGGYFIIQIIKTENLPLKQKLVPVYPKDNPLESQINKTIEFELIDEFTHPELYTDISFMDGIKYAKLKN